MGEVALRSCTTGRQRSRLRTTRSDREPAPVAHLGDDDAEQLLACRGPVVGPSFRLVQRPGRAFAGTTHSTASSNDSASVGGTDVAGAVVHDRCRGRSGSVCSTLADGSAVLLSAARPARIGAARPRRRAVHPRRPQRGGDGHGGELRHGGRARRSSRLSQGGAADSMGVAPGTTHGVAGGSRGKSSGGVVGAPRWQSVVRWMAGAPGAAGRRTDRWPRRSGPRTWRRDRSQSVLSACAPANLSRPAGTAAQIVRRIDDVIDAHDPIGPRPRRLDQAGVRLVGVFDPAPRRVRRSTVCDVPFDQPRDALRPRRTRRTSTRSATVGRAPTRRCRAAGSCPR